MAATEILEVGSVTLPNRAILAPMSGVCDWPFRRLVARYGAGLVVSEMIAGDRLAAREDEARLKAEGEGLDTHAVQIAGCRPETMAEAAKVAEAAGARLIDINMGCPAKRVVGGWAGSALMGDVALAARLVAATVGAVSVPVTVKMRLGLDTQRLNAAELAKRVVEEGAQMVSVHGRTRAQRYKGRADWGAIGPVVSAVSVPVVANGDCTCAADAQRMLALSGARAVMVGRASLGAPWLVGAIAAALDGRPKSSGDLGTAVPPFADPVGLGSLAQEHADALISHVGRARGVRLFRKHLAAYADHVRAPETLRRAALTAETPSVLARAIAALFASARWTMPEAPTADPDVLAA